MASREGHYDPEGQGEQELGGARTAVVPKETGSLCCKNKTKQLTLMQRKVIMLTHCVFFSIPDGNHRDKKSQYKFMEKFFGEVLLFPRGSFHLKNIQPGWKQPIPGQLVEVYVYVVNI